MGRHGRASPRKIGRPARVRDASREKSREAFARKRERDGTLRDTHVRRAGYNRRDVTSGDPRFATKLIISPSCPVAADVVEYRHRSRLPWMDSQIRGKNYLQLDLFHPRDFVYAS